MTYISFHKATSSCKSSLSAMLASSGRSSNPFSDIYAAISGHGDSHSTNIQLYFPHARQPRGKAMHLNVRSDATVEEVIGFSLWTYWDEGCLPKLDDGLGGEDDPKSATRLSAAGWILRIAEEDGEVDDDFPGEVLLFLRTIVALIIFGNYAAPDRMGKIANFNSEAYAILQASPAQSES